MCGSMGKKKKMKYKDGGKVKGNFPDLTGDGKVTKKDILKGRGVKGMMVAVWLNTAKVVQLMPKTKVVKLILKAKELK